MAGLEGGTASSVAVSDDARVAGARSGSAAAGAAVCGGIAEAAVSGGVEEVRETLEVSSRGPG